MNQCKIRLLDEVYIVLVGLKDEHLKFLYEKFAIKTKDYVFNPRYKLGIWDGKINYMQPNGKTFAYLLDEILPIIVKFGYKVSIEDLRTIDAPQPSVIDDKVFSHIAHLETGEPIMLREYQVAGVNALLNNGNGVCLAGTGAGKTLMCSALVRAYDLINVKSLTIVPDGGLIRQTKAEYINVGLDAGEYSGTAKTLDHRHIVSTWQALKNNPQLVTQFQMVIVDECHGLRGRVLNNILTKYAGAIPYRYGFTGTLPKDPTEVMDVHVAVGPVRYEVSAADLIDRGVLAKLEINCIQLEEDLTAEYKEWLEEEAEMTMRSKPPAYTDFKENYFPDYSAEKSYIHRKEMRMEWIADYILSKQLSGKGNIMVLVDSIPVGRQLAAMVPGSVFVNGQDVKKPADREKIYNMFKDRDDFVMFATVHIAGTGISINRIFNVMLIDIGKSFTRVVQAIGRGLRKGAGKDSVTVDDICSDLKYGTKHMKQRIAYYKESRYPFKKHKIDYVKMMTSLDNKL